MKNPTIDLTFPHNWQAQILSARPLILPTRNFAYPAQAEEVERGALELLIRPTSPVPAESQVEVLKGPDFSRAAHAAKSERALAPEGRVSQPSPGNPLSSASSEPYAAPEFLATCALGFRDATVPTGLWSTPNPAELCAVSGGYAYILNTTAPSGFTMIPFRPVLEVRPLAAQGLLLFVGHHAILAWGPNGQVWQSEKLSDEGVTISFIDANQLHGQGWSMITDQETQFTLDLSTGLRI